MRNIYIHKQTPLAFFCDIFFVFYYHYDILLIRCFSQLKSLKRDPMTYKLHSQIGTLGFKKKREMKFDLM
jgi:hypothetical protein